MAAAQDREPALTGGRLATHLVRPSPLSRDDSFYQQYVASLDGRIRTEYLDRWSFHNLQALYGASTDDVKHLSPGSLEFINAAPTEVDARRAFAEQVMRLRMEQAFRTYLAPRGGIEGLRRAEQAFNAVKNQSLRLGGNSPAARPSPFAGEVRYGYDVFTDFSKVEYACPAFDLGYYHSYFVTALAGGQGRGRPVFAQLAARPGATMPTPALRYRFDNDSVETSLSKALAPTMSASLITVHPTRVNGVPKSVGITLSYQF